MSMSMSMSNMYMCKILMPCAIPTLFQRIALVSFSTCISLKCISFIDLINSPLYICSSGETKTRLSGALYTSGCHFQVIYDLTGRIYNRVLLSIRELTCYINTERLELNILLFESVLYAELSFIVKVAIAEFLT